MSNSENLALYREQHRDYYREKARVYREQQKKRREEKRKEEKLLSTMTKKTTRKI